MASRTFLRRWLASRTPDDAAKAGNAATPAIDPAAHSLGARRAQADESFPAFLTSAVDRPTARARNPLTQARLLLRDLFAPAQPVMERGRFAGRLDVLATLIEIIEEQRSHVVVYGERGIGKTSLMHILGDLARESQYIVSYQSCGANSRFDEIFRAALAEVPLLYLGNLSPLTAEAESGASFADKLPAEGFNARELGALCARVTGTRVLIVLDEYDRIEDASFRESVAELIKNLSDRAARVHLVIAGVASNLQELIGYIPSIRRNVIGLPMPRLASKDVAALIAIGETAAGIRFDPRVIEMIDLLANGSPYLVRLLSHHASMKALDAGRLEVLLDDIDAALDKAVDEAEGRVAPVGIQQIERCLAPDRAALVGAVARAASTPDGWFGEAELHDMLSPDTTPSDLRTELLDLSREQHLLDADLAGEAPRFRFHDEALPTYLWLRVARDHLAAGGAADALARHAPRRAARVRRA